MQQINFYLPEFQPNREPFRSSQIIVFSIAIMFLLAVFTVMSFFDNQSLAKKLEDERIQAQGLKDQLQQFANTRTQINIVELDNKIIQIKNEIARRQQLLQVISYQRLGNDRGFSTQLEAMARQSNPQIALEIFSIKQGGDYVELVGKTTSADQLPAYIRALKSENIFRDVSFGVLKIEPVQKGSRYLQFVLAEPEQASNAESVSAVQVYVKNNSVKKGP